MKQFAHIAAMLPLALAAGCASTAAPKAGLGIKFPPAIVKPVVPANPACATAKRTWSEKDSLQTIKDAEAFNAALAKNCPKK